MPNGRLSRCVIDCRKPVEVYHNTSGNAASVSLFANAISTNTNTELSVVVGIASTTLRALTTQVSAAVGTFCSMSNTVYTCDICTGASGVSTYAGINKVASAGTHYCDNNSCWTTYNGAPPVQVSPFGIFVDAYGNQTKTIGGCTTTATDAGGASGTFVYNCLKEGCCVHHFWGGNEQQNPAIWMRQYPASCRDDGTPFWGGKVVGFMLNCCCACCTQNSSGCNGVPGTWYPIRGTNVGMGYSANAVTNAQQLLANWCCCCGQVGANKVPINAYSGCPACRDNDASCFGNVCHYQWCSSCACHCSQGGAFKMFNYYALDNDFYCCCDGFNSNDAQCWDYAGRLPSNAPGVTSACLTKADEGQLRTPPWFVWYRCQGQSEGCMREGMWRICWYPNNNACGCTCWQDICTGSIQSGVNTMYWPYNTWSCYCHVCCTGTFMVNSWCQTQSCKISPFTFVWGMTNCAMAVYIGTDGVGSENYRHARYYITYPHTCYFRRCENNGGNCYFYEAKEFCVPMPESNNNNHSELPFKYFAWNCNVTNKHGTKGCLYIMSRSACPGSCGIFTYDVHDFRVQLGPFCGCTNATWQCHNQICCYCQMMFDQASVEAGWDIKKVADFPAAMTCAKYFGPSYKEMCVSCLYRSDVCTWNMQLYNFESNVWDGFISSDLITWSALPDPYSVKISDVLTTTVTSDYACIVDDCNCFFSNMDCSGIIDYKVDINQYERTGIVLSDGDRIMVNNNGDVQTSFQVWGYEG